MRSVANVQGLDFVPQTGSKTLLILTFIGMNFEKEIATILSSRRSDSDMANIMEMLAHSPDEFQKGFDIALEMENRNLVKLIYSNFNANKIIVEFTLLGKANL
jgi:endonuclease III